MPQILIITPDTLFSEHIQELLTQQSTLSYTLDKPIKTTTNTYEETYLSPEEFFRQVTSTLTQHEVLCYATTHPDNVFKKEVVRQLRQTKQHYELALISEIRTDTLTALLAVTNNTELFDYILASPTGKQTPLATLYNTLQSKGALTYIYTANNQHEELAHKHRITRVTSLLECS